MIEEKIIDVIKKGTTSLLECPFNQAEVEKSLNDIHTHFQKITEITGFDLNIEHMAAIPASKGK